MVERIYVSMEITFIIDRIIDENLRRSFISKMNMHIR